MNGKSGLHWEENLKKNPILKLTAPAVLAAIGVREPELTSKVCYDIILEEITNDDSKFKRVLKDKEYANRRIQPIIQAIAAGGGDYRGVRCIDLRFTLQMHTSYIVKGQPDRDSVYIIESATRELEEHNDERIEAVVPMSYTTEAQARGLWWFES